MLQWASCVYRVLVPVFLFLFCALAQTSCLCTKEPTFPAMHVRPVLACKPQHAISPVEHDDESPETIVPGALSASVSISATGEANLSIPLSSIPGRAGIEPQLSIVYSSAAGDGPLGAGFSLAGYSAITRCPSNLALDGEIRGVRYDEQDKLCLDGKRLVLIKEAPGIFEYRTYPDTFVKIVGHGDGVLPDWFEVYSPSGVITEYGKAEGTKPLALGSAPRAWLAGVVRDRRGNTMEYGYCFANAEGYTAEYALDEIRYTGFEGTQAQEPTRIVKLHYGVKDAEEIRRPYAGGMELQNALALDEILMIGPDETLVRRYDLAYQQSPTTRRALLAQIKECDGAANCKPPTRFSYRSNPAGFERMDTGIAKPTSSLASPLLTDMDGDGLDDLLIPDTNPILTTPQNPITEWKLARSLGDGQFDAPTLAFSQEWPFVQNPVGSSDPSMIQPELGTALDYDQDGRTDILLHDVYGNLHNETVLIAQPDQTFLDQDTGIPRPFPLGAAPLPPTLTTPVSAVHLADLNGDGVADRIQCDNATSPNGRPQWKLHLWQPGGFTLLGDPVAPLDDFACDVEFYPVDINADGKLEIVVPTMFSGANGEQVLGSTFSALSRRANGSYEVLDTALPLPLAGGRVLFADVNGDGLPDAIQSGQVHSRLVVFLNRGGTFSTLPENAFFFDGLGKQDTFFRFALPLDYDGDGRYDLLMPIAGNVSPNLENPNPKWFILRASGKYQDQVFETIDPHIPFEPLLGDAITLADPRGPRVGDVDGDGAADVVLVLNNQFSVFRNLASDQDVLVAVSDGMNEREPEDSAYVPTIEIQYEHLATGDYNAHADPSNGCEYPRRCLVGSLRVVSEYALDDGEGGQRRFAFRYEDGRYDRRGFGFLGFGKRVVTALDTGAGTIELYDNKTFIQSGALQAYPYAGQALRTQHFSPGLPTQPQSEHIELSFVDTTPTFVPTNNEKTFFTMPIKRRLRRLQGIYPPPNDPSQPIEAYVADIEANGGATLLRDSSATVTNYDEFGNILGANEETVGIDLKESVERTFKHDTTEWILSRLDWQKECSIAAGFSSCRILTRVINSRGEVDSESQSSDDGSQEAKLDVVYERDSFGNIETVTADDAYGHHRVSTTSYDAYGYFPRKHINAAGHVTDVEFDTRLGVPTKETDPNLLVTTWPTTALGVSNWRLGRMAQKRVSNAIASNKRVAGEPRSKPRRTAAQTTPLNWIRSGVPFAHFGMGRMRSTRRARRRG